MPVLRDLNFGGVERCVAEYLSARSRHSLAIMEAPTRNPMTTSSHRTASRGAGSLNLPQPAGQARVGHGLQLLPPHQPCSALVRHVGQEVLIEELLGSLDRDSQDLGRLTDGDPVRLGVMGVAIDRTEAPTEGF